MKKALILLLLLAAAQSGTAGGTGRPFAPEAAAALSFTVSATAGPGGGISPSGDVIVAEGGDQSFAITADPGYSIADVHVDTVSVGPVGSYTFTSVNADHSIEAFFSLNTYDIVATAWPGGAISPSGTVSVNHGESRSFVITPNSGYHIDSVVVDGAKTDSTTGYTFTNVTTSHTIAAYFSINTYTIAATAGPNGSVSPSGPVSVNHGSDRTFLIAPNPGYHIDSVLVDGAKTDSTTSYTFYNVTANHSILAFFSVNVYTITATAGPNGTIAPSGSVNVTHGSDRTFLVTPNSGYHIDSVVVDGSKTDSTTSYTFRNVAAGHTIAAYFSINTYTIAATAGPNGSISPSGIVSVNHGASRAFTITPNSGYHVDSVVVDGLRTDSTTRYTFTNVTANHSIVAFFSLNTYTITATASAGGSISPSGAVGVDHGSDRTFTVTPAPGYHVDSVLVDGANVGAVSGYTFSNVTSGHTISAWFSVNVYTITATASAGGTITPTGAVSADHGSDRTFLVAPNTGYHIDSVVVDGAKTDSTTSYTFRNVTGNHTISVHFSIDVFVVTAGATSGGSISPSGAVDVNYGASGQFVVTPDAGHHTDSIVVDGARVDSMAGYTFVNVTSDHTIQAYFSINTYTITATAGANGTITPSGAVSVDHGGSRAFVVTPAPGYHVDSILVDGAKVDSMAGYTFVNVTSDHTVQAFFTINMYFVTSGAGPNGTITPSGVTSITHGGNLIYKVAPNAGYHTDSIVVDGARVDSTAGYTFVNVTSNHTIQAYFSINTYTITATAGANGTITPSGAVSVDHGASRAFVVTPNTGYHVDSIVVDGAKTDSTSGYTFVNVTSNHSIQVYFSVNSYTITATAAAGGTISPSGAVGVIHGVTRGFTVSPDPGYHTDSILVDGAKVDSMTGYTFVNVTSDHTIEAFFTINTYTITATAAAGGTISPSGAVGVTHGSSRAFTVNPDPGYHTDSILVDGAKVDSMAGYTFVNVTTDHTIEAFFTINTYTITATAAAGGTISPSGPVGVDHGETLRFTMAPDTGYHVDSILVDGAKTDSTAGYTFVDVGGDHTIEAFFSINAYTITATAGPNGSITPGGVVGVSYGGTSAFAIRPDTGYHVDSVVVDGARVDSTASYTFVNVTSDHTIGAFFTINTYTITATAGAGGTISPEGAVGVDHGDALAFTVTPDTGYHTDSILVDGARVDSTGGYTFTGVTTGHTIEAFFSINAYTITATAGPNGTITPSGAVGVTHGGSRSFTITPDAGYHVDSVVVDGAKVDSTISFTFTNVTAPHAIEAFFSINVYTITATAGPNGSITPSGPVDVGHGSSRAFIVTPDPGYHVDSILVDDVKVDSTAGYTFLNVTAPHTIGVFFSINVYTITATASAGGAIAPSGPVSVSHGASRSFTFAPDPNHHLDSVLVDGARVDSATGYTFTDVTAPHSIRAFFSIDTYPITVTAGPNGSISPSGVVQVAHASSMKFSITPSTGYHVDSVLVDGARVDSTASFTFTNVTAPHSIQAFFSINIYRLIATAGVHGTINPSGEFYLPHGSTQAFAITPDPGYHVDSVLVNGVKTDSTLSLTLRNISSDQTVFAYFSINTYTITATAGANGTITPSGAVTVVHNATRSFAIAPNPGCHLDSVVVDGVKVDSTTSYTFRFVTAGHTISAFFSVNTYTITAGTTGNGTITPSGPVTVAHGASRSFAFAPDTGYQLDSVVVDGKRTDSTTSYTFSNVTANHTITAFFRIISFPVTIMAGPDGTVSPSGTVSVNYGDSLRVNILPDIGYYVADVLVDNVSQGPVTSYTFRDVTAGHVLQAFFSTNAPPTAPRLSSPVDGDTIPVSMLGTARFSWEGSTDLNPGDILTYSVRFTGPGTSFSSGGITGTSVVLDLRGILLAGNEYRWTVSVDDGSVNVFSPDTFRFRVDVTTGIVDEGSVPDNYALGQNYPNPFNPATTFRFDLPERASVSLKVYNVLGTEVYAVLEGEDMPAGRYRSANDFSGLPSGTYFYRLLARGESGREFSAMRKMVLLK